VDAGGIAIIAGTLAALITAYPVAIWLERFQMPPYWPDTQDDPRCINVMREWGRPTESIGGGADQRGRASRTHTDRPFRTHGDWGV
jgi:hypothetical protein